VELQGRVKELKDRGLGLAAISYDPPEILAAFSKQRGITFPLLSDVGSETIKRYGLLNTVAIEAAGPNANDPALAEEIKTYVSVVGANPRVAGIAFPGTFILDRSGRVKARFFEDFYITRNTVSSILMRTRSRAPVPGTKISTEHLDVTAYASDTAIAPGNRLTLAFNVVPHRGMHVYAPGAAGYRIIEAKLEPQAVVRALPMKYPPSQIYFFKPLNERVPVYEKPFTLLQDIELVGTPQAQAALRGRDSLTLNATLEYQACDAKICFNPESVPLSWTFTLRPLVLERPSRPQ
jgi:peroxiredoxin